MLQWKEGVVSIYLPLLLGVAGATIIRTSALIVIDQNFRELSKQVDLDLEGRLHI